MSSFLPSEVSRLVLGYLEEVECKAAYQAFLDECPHLAECRGRIFFTHIMGYSLVEILDDFCGVQAYLLELSKTEDFKKKVLRCATLLEKIKLFVNKDDENGTMVSSGSSLTKQSAQHQSSGKRNKQTSPLLRPSQSYSVHKTNRVRSNSCDSVMSNSAFVGMRNQGYKKSAHTRSVESIAEATKLVDLPGNKKYSVGCQTKYHVNSSWTEKRQNFSNDTNKSVKYESEEDNFRSALGLVRNGDLQERHSLIPHKPVSKSRISGRKQATVIKKTIHVPDPIPNETLDVTTITHTLLDCTEFHEKLAENINKIYSNLSVSKVPEETHQSLHTTHKYVMESEAKAEVCASEASLPVVPQVTVHPEDNIVEEIPQLDSVIKSIVEKTEKDPIFDQLVNEVLAASVESSSGSEFDFIIRPGTSTPEKSSNSRIQESSPTHSWISKDDDDYKFDKYVRPQFGSKRKAYYRDKSKMRPLPLKHSNCYTFHQYYKNRKYQRYPRGGKRMEILRETYASSFCENDDELPMTQHPNVIDEPAPSTSKTSYAKSEPKVVILSDEIINPNPITNKCQLTIEPIPRKEIPHIVSVSKPEEMIIKSCKGNSGSNNISSVQPIPPNITTTHHHPPITLIQSFPDPRLQAKHDRVEDPSHHQILTLKTVKPFEDNSAPNIASTKFVGEEHNTEITQPSISSLIPNSASGSDCGVSSQNTNSRNCELRKFRKRFIKAGQNIDMSSDKPMTYYSEVDIMKMPTVFVEPSGSLEDTQTFVPVSTNLISNNMLGIEQSGSEVQENSLPITGSKNTDPSNSKSKLLFGHKVPLQAAHGLISSMVHDTGGTHILQIDAALMGNKEHEGATTEVVFATKNSTNTNCDAASNTGLDSNELGSVSKTTEEDKTKASKDGISTPKTKSHVRILDFDTPPKTMRLRRAQSSPKMSTRSMETTKPFLTPSTCKKPRTKNVKSKLFPAIAESPNEDEDKLKPTNNTDVVKVEVVAGGIWDEVNGVGQILKKSNSSQNPLEQPQAETIKKKDNKKKKKKVEVLKPVVKSPEPEPEPKEYMNEKEFEEEAAAIEWARIRNVNKKCWDQEMRLVLASHATGREPYVPKKRKHITNNKSQNICINLDDSDEMSKSTEDEAKLLEDALNRTTGLTPAKVNDETLKTSDTVDSKGKVKEAEVIVDQSDENVNCDINSSQSDVKNFEPNNKDYLLNVKLFRDSMKTQQVDTCKFVTYSNPSVAHSSSTKKPKKTIKNKKTFKVKFSKNSKEFSESKAESLNLADNEKMDEENVDEIVISDDCEETVTKNQQGKKLSSNPLPAENFVPETSKNEALLTPIEPPVPSVKITPDMPREQDFNHLNAKCNLNVLLETPFKFEILDLHMDTPKYISPGFFKSSLSSIKISDIPTPSFPFLPELTKTPISMNKEPTPGSYSSRPTDYSSSSSYYKPDEFEFNLDIKNNPTTTKSSSKKLTVVNEESESPEETSKRVLRPRRSKTVYYPDTYSRTSFKNKNDSNDNSLNKSNSINNSGKLKTSLKENLPSQNTKTNSISDISLEKSALDLNTHNSSKRTSIEIARDLNYSSSSSSTFNDDNLADIARSLKSTSTPNIKKPKRQSDITKEQLEEKRQRVLKKLKKSNAEKSSHQKSNQTTKVSIKGKRICNKTPTKDQTTSPSTPLIKSNEHSLDSSLKENKEEVDKVSKNVVTPQLTKTVSSKSRRKSSTPRKLMQSEIGNLTSPSDSISDGDHNSEKAVPKIIEVGEIAESTNNVSDKSNLTSEASSVQSNKTLETSSVQKKSQDNIAEIVNKETSKENLKSKEALKSDQENTSSLADNNDDYVTLHLSDDEADKESSGIPGPMDSYDINHIKEFLASTSNEDNNAAFRTNLLNQGFDKTSIEAIEKELVGSPVADNIFHESMETKECIDSLKGKENAGDKLSSGKGGNISSQKVKDVPISKTKFTNDSKHSKGEFSSKSSKKHSDHRDSKHSRKSKDMSHRHVASPKKSLHKSLSDKNKKLSLSKYRARRKHENEKAEKERKTSKNVESKIAEQSKTSDKESKMMEHSKSRVKEVKEMGTKMIELPKMSSQEISFNNNKVINNTKTLEKQIGCLDSKITEHQTSDKETSDTFDSNVCLENIKVTDNQDSTFVDISDKNIKSKAEKTNEGEQQCIASCNPESSNTEGDDIDEVVFFSCYDFNAASSNFISYKYVAPKTKRKQLKHIDISEFKIKAEVYNTETDRDEIRDIKVTEVIDLLELQPDKLKLQRLKRKEAKLKKASEKEKEDAANKSNKKFVVENLFGESESQSSTPSIDEINDPKAIAETNMAVKSILMDEGSISPVLCSPVKIDLNPKIPTSPMPDISKKQTADDPECVKLQMVSTEKSDIQDAGSTIDSPIKTQEEPAQTQEIVTAPVLDFRNIISNTSLKDENDLMNFAVVKAVDLSKSSRNESANNDTSATSNEIPSIAEKRKRDEGTEDDSLHVKKNKLSSPQSLLMKIDIDAVLSKLHGPK